MQLHSCDGKILYEGRFATIKACVEAAVREQVRLEHINLRKACLRGAELDTARMSGACLWGADLSNANMALGNFTGADLRAAILENACLAESILRYADCRGTFFKNAIIRMADLTGIQFSSPSFFNLDLDTAGSLSEAVYIHHGRFNCPLSLPPLVIKGAGAEIVLLDRHAKLNGQLFSFAVWERENPELANLCLRLNTTINRNYLF